MAKPAAPITPTALMNAVGIAAAPVKVLGPAFVVTAAAVVVTGVRVDVKVDADDQVCGAGTVLLLTDAHP